MYNIDWPFFVAANIPSEWIRPRRLSLLALFLWPVTSLHAAFLTYREESLYKLNFNGQIIYLEHALNDRFDSTARGIYINNVADINAVYVYNKVELKPPFYLYNLAEGYGPVYFKNAAEYATIYDFIVMVPASVTFDLSEMMALVHCYKAAGRRFTIQTY